VVSREEEVLSSHKVENWVLHRCSGSQDPLSATSGGGGAGRGGNCQKHNCSLLGRTKPASGSYLLSCPGIPTRARDSSLNPCFPTLNFQLMRKTRPKAFFNDKTY
jgi:hypothetical protein